jgi:hypothetical protein
MKFIRKNGRIIPIAEKGDKKPEQKKPVAPKPQVPSHVGNLAINGLFGYAGSKMLQSKSGAWAGAGAGLLMGASFGNVLGAFSVGRRAGAWEGIKNFASSQTGLALGAQAGKPLKISSTISKASNKFSYGASDSLKKLNRVRSKAKIKKVDGNLITVDFGKK